MPQLKNTKTILFSHGKLLPSTKPLFISILLHIQHTCWCVRCTGHGDMMDDRELEVEVINQLNEVLDPEVGISVMDMGLVQDIKVKDGVVSLVFVPSSPFCPMGVRIAFDILHALNALDFVLYVKRNTHTLLSYECAYCV
jgi:metal-sulfur cluster biosynthetic enzyme